ncbi:hypothetical protein F4780DRAFT_77300 [Xylariomycetidae sp. FL0641]|nr:hypothetical protein F4780DRAFT_77300 [Xylariomycetidae sp. FL0641]
MQGPDHYPEPSRFNGFRFVDTRAVKLEGSFGISQPRPSKLTDVDSTWHVWGTGRMACPGRYYAVAVMKVIMGQIILNYDCDLVDRTSSRLVTWRSTMLPKPSTKVVFTPLEGL